MNDCYTPYTGEHIATDTPADWMARAGIDAPAYDKATQGCFFQGGAWVVIDSAKAENPRIEEIKAELTDSTCEEFDPSTRNISPHSTRKQ